MTQKPNELDILNHSRRAVAVVQAGISGVDDPSWPNATGHYLVKEADFSAFPNYAS